MCFYIEVLPDRVMQCPIGPQARFSRGVSMWVVCALLLWLGLDCCIMCKVCPRPAGYEAHLLLLQADWCAGLVPSLRGSFSDRVLVLGGASCCVEQGGSHFVGASQYEKVVQGKSSGKFWAGDMH